VDEQAIAEMISVHPPYLWLDEVIELTSDRIRARKRIDPDLPLFAGHYVGFPLFPGALQCEACFQASNVLLTKILPENPGTLPVIARVRNVKFKRLVRPGDLLDIEVVLKDRVGKAIYMTGRCSVAGDVSASLEFVATETPLPTA
jgi:3-hydroxyacyl-[acyl-carrier-protein] dehydratase